MFDFGFCRSVWGGFCDALVECCADGGEWHVLFSVALTVFLDVAEVELGGDGCDRLAGVALGGAVCVSEISRV